jgi:hypothetical protein
MSTYAETRPLLPPFTGQAALQRVRLAAAGHPAQRNLPWASARMPTPGLCNCGSNSHRGDSRQRQEPVQSGDLS